jgi:hypothetical protein
MLTEEIAKGYPVPNCIKRKNVLSKIHADGRNASGTLSHAHLLVQLTLPRKNVLSKIYADGRNREG